MSARGTRQRLQDMLDAVTLIEGYVTNLSDAEFLKSPMVRDAVERNIERISEASRHLPEKLRATEPSIPWRAIADMGNVLRHGYDSIDARRIWAVTTRDLDPLKAAILRMIESQTSE